MDIVSYYKARGMDYFEERKKCRQYISRRPSEFSPLTDNEKLTGGAVFWDEYSPPPGYTWEDLEGIPIPEDPMPDSPKGLQISPCVLKAANLKFQQKTPVSSSPIPSSQNFRDIIDQLESIQTGRKKFMEEKRKKKEQKQQAMIENDNGNQAILMEVSAVENEVSAERSVENDEFPNDEDSFVQRATQLEERVIVAVNPSRDMNIEVNRATINSSRILSPRNPVIGGNTPVTSGNRLPFRNKCQRRSDLKRPSSGRLDFSNELSESPVKKSSTTTSPDSEESFSFFDKSAVENKDTTTETPKVVIGDFAEDDDDVLFSQIPMPEVLQQDQNSEKTVPVNEKSTELLSANSSATSDFEEGYSITDAMMGEIDQLEAQATVEQSKVYTSTPLQNLNNTPAVGSGLRKSARINTHNLSAIKVDASNNNLNESNEKPPSKSRLSRSYVRYRK